MTVNSLLSFSVAAYSGRRVLLKWQNPYAAAGKPYSGVIIKASRGGYPAWNASAWDAIFQEQETMLPREPGHRRLWITSIKYNLLFHCPDLCNYQFR